MPPGDANRGGGHWCVHGLFLDSFLVWAHTRGDFSLTPAPARLTIGR